MSSGDARSVLHEQHDRAEAALGQADGGGDLLGPLEVLGQMRTQVLYREVRETLDDGEPLAAASGESQRELSRLIGPAGTGDAEALDAMRKIVAKQRKSDDQALDRLAKAGADLDALGEQMRVYAE